MSQTETLTPSQTAREIGALLEQVILLRERAAVLGVSDLLLSDAAKALNAARRPFL